MNCNRHPWLSVVHRGLLALCLAYVAWACEAPEAEAPPAPPADCGGACGPGTVCVNGGCTRLRAPAPMDASVPQDQGILDAEVLPDIPFIDAAPAPDAAPMPDLGPLPDLGPIPDMALPCEPSEEVCDGRDNDCDDRLDENIPTVGNVCGTDQLGVCSAGIVACTDGALVCEGTVSPSAEVCDNLDNDCDGEIDNDVAARAGVECPTGQTGVCRPGYWTCRAGDWACVPVTPAEPEGCDGLDNDCDGETDEDVPEVGQACQTENTGVCGRGLFFCNEGALGCAQIFEPLDEICDGEDNDCDGVADETFPEQGVACATEGQGICGAGVAACVDVEGEIDLGMPSRQVLCVQAEAQRDELCDGLDDDCDGLTDELYDRLGEACVVGVGACARPGDLGCTEDGLDYACSGETGEPSPEVCDDIDNDCDGETDNLLAPPQEPDHCGACGEACDLPRAFPRCEESVCRVSHCHRNYVNLDGADANGCEFRCRTTDPVDEVCDGLDNDCDGVVDGEDVCFGDAFDFCRLRRQAGERDLLCEGFKVGELPIEYFGPSSLGAGDGEISGDNFYALDAPTEIGAGHNRRIPRLGPTFQLGLSLEYHHPVAVGMGHRGLADLAAEGDDEPPLWAGYSLWIGPGEAGLEAVIRAVPAGEVLWRGDASSLDDGRRHFVDWRRGADGGFQVFVDGATTTPLFAAPLDVTTGAFDELSLWLGPLDDGARSTRIDALALQDDPDLDGVPTRVDNCPDHHNPDQVDADANGHGEACDDRDGDGIENSLDPCPIFAEHSDLDANENGVDDACDVSQPLLLTLTRFATEAPWLLDLGTGQQWRPANMPPNTAHHAAGRVSPIVWTVYPDDVPSVFGAGPEGESALLGPRKRAGDWLGERLMYHSPAYDAVYLARTPFEVEDPLVVQVEAGSTVRASASVDEEHIVAVINDGESVVGRLFDAQGNPLEGGVGGPTRLPQEDDPQSFPSVDWHPETGRYLVGSLAGEATGISVVDPIRAGALGLVERPTYTVRYLPDGSGFVALHPGETGGVSLVLYRGVAPGVAGTTLIDDVHWLRPMTLDWGHRVPVMPDADDDGVVDGLDPCPAQPVRADRWVVPVEALPNTNGADHNEMRLLWNGQDYFASWSYFSPNTQGRLIRLSRDGALLQDFGRVGNCTNCSGAPEPLWYGDRYRLFQLGFRSPGHGRLWYSDLNRRGVRSDRIAVDLGFEGEEQHYRWVRGIRRGHMFRLALRGNHYTPSRFVSLPGEIPAPAMINNGIDAADYWAVPGVPSIPNMTFTGTGRFVATPNEGAAFLCAEAITAHTRRPALSVFDGPVIRQSRNSAGGRLDAVGVGRSVWAVYSGANERSLMVRRYDLTDEETDAALVVTDVGGEPRAARLVNTGEQIGIFWLQTVGNDVLMFSRWMTLEGEFLGPPVAITPRGQRVRGTFGAAWDGQQTAILYAGPDGLVFQRGDVQCW